MDLDHNTLAKYYPQPESHNPSTSSKMLKWLTMDIFNTVSSKEITMPMILSAESLI